MRYYAAPMEGITGYVYRNAHHHYYPGMDKYFTPFLTPKRRKGMNSKETNDILPEHNPGLYLVPQILTNQAEDFLSLLQILREYGYREVNLNLGCPSGTVVSKGKGCGFLKDRDKLRRFLEDTMNGLEGAGLSDMQISLKTRLGVEEPVEIMELMKIYNDYPLSEIILHARVLKDYYKYPARPQVYREAASICRHPICYNGDIYRPEDIRRIREVCPDTDCVMLGRGLIADPQLGQSCLQNQEGGQKADAFDYERFFRFHEEIRDGYIEIMSGERNVLFKMKELWSYMAYQFPGQDKIMKKIRKASNLMEYNHAVDALSYM